MIGTALLAGSSLIFLPILLITLISLSKKLRRAPATAPAIPINTNKKWWWISFASIILVLATLMVLYSKTDLQMEQSFFRGMLLGGGLLWMGKKLSKVTFLPGKIWGWFFVGVGSIIIAVSLWQSGFRHSAEQSVNWVDKSLTEVATGQGSGESGSALPRILRQSSLEEVKMGGDPVGTVKHITIPVNGKIKIFLGTPQVGTKGYYWSCLKVKGGFNPALQFEAVAGQHSGAVTLRLTEASLHQALRMEVTALNVVLNKVQSVENPCTSIQ
jgi:heme/copper-type cytochrome/quinol oxidase subunit 2